MAASKLIRVFRKNTLTFLHWVRSFHIPKVKPWKTTWLPSLKSIKANYQLILVTAGVLVGLYVTIVGVGAFYIYKKDESTFISRFSEKIFPYPAAIVNHRPVYLSRFRLEVTARENYTSKNGIDTTAQETQQNVINQLVNRALYEKSLDVQGIQISDTDVENKLNEIYGQIGGKDTLVTFLHENYGEKIGIPEFRTWIRESLVDSAIKRQVLETATVSHILISVPDNATDEQVEIARKKILEIKAKVTDAASFSTLAKQYSEDVASRDKDGSLGVTNRGSDAPVFSTDFENAVFSIPLNTVSDPVRSTYGWHLVFVTERSGFVKESLSQYTEELKKQYGVRIFVGKS